MTLVLQEAASATDRAEVMDDRLIEALQAIAPVKTGELLSRHTTFGIGGPADVLVTVRNADELARAVIAARGAGAPVFILGAGSNILVGDGGIRGVVIDNQAKAIEGPLSPSPSPNGGEGSTFVVRAESGVAFASLAKQLAREGYGGVEWAAGIPGTMGGAVVYNAGAYDGCLADVLLAVTMLDDANEQRSVPAAAMKLAYRSSTILRGECAGCIVLAVEIAVRQGESAELTRRIAAFDAQRLGAQPRGRNSGSTFKNPPDDNSWRLIDATGLRGHRIGGARISEKHSNFIENLGAARAADVAALMHEAQRRVREQFGIDLENEVELVGEGFA